jgi:hypothetical protein
MPRMTFGRWLKKGWAEQELTPEQLAELVGYSPGMRSVILRLL